jgi:hypothetical protein
MARPSWRMMMPVQECQREGKPGYRWGQSGKCYTYTPGNARERAEARLRAEMQGRAARKAGYRENA